MEVSNTILLECCRLAHEAGQRIMKFYGGNASVVLKKDASPLTEADAASHNYLAEHLLPLLPGVPLISEESEESHKGPGDANSRYWLIDPLDGTKEFIKATNEFTVNIALMEGGRTVLGVVYAPALNLSYYGLRNAGAWRQSGGEPPVPISTRRAEGNLSVVASKDHAGPLVQTMLSRLDQPTLKSMGSSLKFCLVAEGKADIYLRDLPTMEWDTAAAQCVVECAGGGVYTLDGRPLAYGKPELRNPAIITTGDARLDWPALLREGAA
ncbi:MAG TPA: 3'(2'),5'-bisphosphate nucleotidase CysQ [Verrucomicrobiae bacterium]|jgi:3'(2'), 5'-bisphosphate nucleotidase